jgi:serine/threonine protein phosphatase PrpC
MLRAGRLIGSLFFWEFRKAIRVGCGDSRFIAMLNSELKRLTVDYALEEMGMQKMQRPAREHGLNSQVEC